MLAVTAHGVWTVVIPVLVVASFVITLFIYIHEPKARTPGPGHPAYEGDEDADD